MNNETLQAAMEIWYAHRTKHAVFPGSDETKAAFALADAFLQEHHPDLRGRMACNRCDLAATCEFALEPNNLDCEPKINCLAAK